jgi:hypothetical protein
MDVGQKIGGGWRKSKPDRLAWPDVNRSQQRPAVRPRRTAIPGMPSRTEYPDLFCTPALRVQFCTNRVVTAHSRSIAATWSRHRMRAQIFIALYASFG